MKRVLVTGASGFIGSNVVQQARLSGLEVRAFVRYNGKSDIGWLSDLPCLSDVDVFFGDIRDKESVKKAIEGCDAVINLAALIGIPYSYRNPRSYLETNVQGVINILESLRESERDLKLVQISTSEVYGSAQFPLISESHPKLAQSPYAASKTAADQFVLSYSQSFDLAATIVRPFNTYGPRQSPRAFIPAVMTQILEGRETLELGSLAPRRDLTFVSDTARAILMALEATNSDVWGTEINLGTGIDLSMQQVLEKIIEITEYKGSVILDSQRVRPEASEVMRLTSDNQKAKTLLNWSPEFTLEDGLLQTFNWAKTQNRPSLSGYLI